MLIVFIIVAIALIVLGIWLISQCCEVSGIIVTVVAALMLIFSVVGIGAQGKALVRGRYLDAQIAMYTEENQAIEKKIADSVNAYLQHESGVMEKLKTNPESSVTIVAAYPELNSSKLIEEQIKIYNTNSQKIKKLKEEKVLLGSRRWWIYFGS